MKNNQLMDRQVLSNIHKPAHPTTGLTHASHGFRKNDTEDNPELYQKGLPVVSFRYVISFGIQRQVCNLSIRRLSDDYKQKYPHVQQSWIQVGCML